MQRYQMILFDMDGTLVDSHRFHSDVVHRFLTQNGVAAEHEVVSQSVGQSVTDVLRACGVPESRHRELAAKLDASYESISSFGDIHLIAGVRETLVALQAEGHTLGLVTNSMGRLVQGILQWFGLAEYFSVVSAAAADATDKKSRCQAVVAESGIPKEHILYVGDAESDIACAAACGIDVCIVLSKYAWARDKEKCIGEAGACVVDDIRALVKMP